MRHPDSVITDDDDDTPARIVNDEPEPLDWSIERALATNGPTRTRLLWRKRGVTRATVKRAAMAGHIVRVKIKEPGGYTYGYALPSK